MKTLHVVAAIIQKDRKIFAAKRGYGKWNGFWEFPGGKTEPGETPEEALFREVKEELGTEISIGEKAFHVEYDYPEFHLSMDCFFAEFVSGNYVLKEHKAAKWLSKEELFSVEWLPADLDLIRRLKEMI